MKREAIDDDLSSQIFKQAHVLFKAIAQWSHRLYEVAFTFIKIVLQKSKFSQDVIELFIGFIMEKFRNIYCEIRVIKCEFKDRGPIVYSSHRDSVTLPLNWTFISHSLPSCLA